MNLKINLCDNKGFGWKNNDQVRAKGFLFDSSNTLYSEDAIVNYFDNICTQNEFINKLKEVNGNFSVIIENGNKVFIAVDRMRSLPIFYYMNDEDLYISDNADWIKNELKLDSFNSSKIVEFKLTGYTIGASTLIDEISQLQAGECLTIELASAPKINKTYYYTHTHGNFFGNYDQDLLDTLDEISNRIIERVAESAKGRMIVVPLSGGYDSRYIAALLKKTGYENVLCYTYGREDSHEVETSKKVADELGYSWRFIEYGQEVWKTLLDDSFIKYMKASHNYSSLPQLQEYYAVKYLKSSDAIDDDAIFIPGFCGDLLGGSYLVNDKDLKKINRDRDRLVSYIYHKHFNLYGYNGEHEACIIEEIEKFIEPFTIETDEDVISINEHFFTCHKVSKFILNSLRIYEYFGFEWRLPLWDNELIEFWYRVSRSERENNRLYNQYLFEYLFQPLDIAFFKKESNSKLKMIKSKLPESITKPMMYIINKYLLRTQRDFNSFSELSGLLMGDLNDTSEVENIYINQNTNHILSLWFIEKILYS